MPPLSVSYATEATPDRANEDYVVAGPDWVVVLDGATQRPDVEPGCVHDPRWLVHRLGAALAGRLTDAPSHPLPQLLASAIEAVGAVHGDGCDLTNPDSPSAAVALLRRRDERLEWLVLADCAVVVDLEDRVEVTLDDRLARLPSYTTEAVRALRNTPQGFWVAGTRPEAAYEALTGSCELSGVRRAAVLTDGATRLVERFGVLGWPGLLDLLDTAGPAELIRRTRAAERAENPAERARLRGKPHDDATAVLLRPA
jgi:protein phosphatase 2C-like protein